MHRVPISLAVFFLTLFIATSSGGFDAGDAVARFYTGISIAEGKKAQLPQDLAMNGISKNAKGERYTYYAPLQSLLYMVPAWYAAKWLSSDNKSRENFSRLIVGLWILPLTSTVVLVLLYLYLLEIGTPERNARIAIVLFGCATCFFHYARNAQEEQLIALFYAGWLWGLARLEHHKRFSLLMMAAGMSGAVASRWAAVPCVLAMGLVSIFACGKQRAHLKFSELAAAISLGLSVAASLLAYNFYRYGNPLVTGLASSSPNPGMSLFSLEAFLPRLSALLFSPYRGFLLYSPIYLLCAAVLLRRSSWRISEWHRYGLILFATNLIFFSMYYYWAGGHSFGPRFLVGCSVFLIPFIVDITSLPKSILLAVGGISFCFMLASTALPASLEDELRDAKGIDPIGTTSAWTFSLTPFVVRPSRVLTAGRETFASSVSTSTGRSHSLFWWQFRMWKEFAVWSSATAVLLFLLNWILIGLASVALLKRPG